MLKGSIERPAWLSNDLFAYNHRFITNKFNRRVRLIDYFKITHGQSKGFVKTERDNK